MGHSQIALTESQITLRLTDRTLPQTAASIESSSAGAGAQKGRGDGCTAPLIPVAELTLDDIDWKRERLSVPERKCGHSTAYPLSSIVGEALIEIREIGAMHGGWRHETNILFWWFSSRGDAAENSRGYKVQRTCCGHATRTYAHVFGHRGDVIHDGKPGNLHLGGSCK